MSLFLWLKSVLSSQKQTDEEQKRIGLTGGVFVGSIDTPAETYKHLTKHTDTFLNSSGGLT